MSISHVFGLNLDIKHLFAPSLNIKHFDLVHK